ncbi:MAG TPA: hypothetical protein VKL61_06385 [Candidatus Polarisedimenticolia bacterium]|nr:hypothetical protein [Candidatus Polarisedimenticolia bacterium]
MSRLFRKMGAVFLAALASATLASASGPGTDDFESILGRIRPDYRSFIGAIRPGRTHLHPATLYMGLVRPGGQDPSLKDDTPLVGHGILNDVIVYADSREAGRSAGWAMLLIDHEYFHARHLSRGDKTPVPSFGDPEASRHYFEAVAWGYNLAQADEDEYPTLTHADYREAFRNYSLHFEAFRDYILMRDRPAWAHYRRFLPDPSTFDHELIARN